MAPSVYSPGDPRIQGPYRRIVLCKPLIFPFSHNVNGKFKCGVSEAAAPVICYPSAKWRQWDLSKCGNNFHFHLYHVTTPVWAQQTLVWRDAPVYYKVLTWHRKLVNWCLRCAVEVGVPERMERFWRAAFVQFINKFFHRWKDSLSVATCHKILQFFWQWDFHVDVAKVSVGTSVKSSWPRSQFLE